MVIRARTLAASLLTLSGFVHVGALWFRDLDTTALVSALFGALYLFVGVGLYGRSRFALFMAIVSPAAGAWLALNNTAAVAQTPLGLAQLWIAAIVILISMTLLFIVRNNPSV